MISYAQNREDVVLWRALGHVRGGHYVEVGANDPSHDSVTRFFYDSGWSGVTVEPVPHFANLQRKERPRDTLVEAAITNVPGEITLHVIPDSGLSTIVDDVSSRHQSEGIEHVDVVVPSIRLDTVLDENGWAGKDIHFMLIDVEGAEAEVLKSVDLSVWRPWVLVVEATAPNSTEQTHSEWEPGILASGYEYCLFDGLSRFYVASEKANQLKSKLSYPACVLDNPTLALALADQHKVAELSGQVIHWRSVALSRWADAVTRDLRITAEVRKLRRELKTMRSSSSWRVTRPLRLARRVLRRG